MVTSWDFFHRLKSENLFIQHNIYCHVKVMLEVSFGCLLCRISSTDYSVTTITGGTLTKLNNQSTGK